MKNSKKIFWTTLIWSLGGLGAERVSELRGVFGGQPEVVTNSTGHHF